MVTFRCWGDLQKTLDKLKNVSTGTLWNSERQTETLTAGKEKSLATAQSEQWAAGQQLCRKGPGHPGGLHMSPVCPGSKLGTAPGLHRAMPRGDLSTSSACQTTQILYSELAAPEQDKLEQVQERATTTVGSEHFTRRRGWGNWVYTARRKTDFSKMTVQHRLLKTKPGSSLWSMDGGWERTGIGWNMENSV